MGGFAPLQPPLLAPLLPPSPPPKGWSIRHPASVCLRGNRWKLPILNKTEAAGLEPLSPVYAPNLSLRGCVPPRSARRVRAESSDGAGFCRAARSALGRFQGRWEQLSAPLPSSRSPNLLRIMSPSLQLSPKGEPGSI